VISLGGELCVSDGQMAVIAFKNIVEDSLAIVREAARAVVSSAVVESGPEGRTSLTRTLNDEFNRELSSRGVEVRNLEITELWAQPLKYSMPTTTN
jgi:TRAP-type C4-dicarboxylate transport system substrate-binding protein